MPIDGCPEFATKDELQELRDQLNEALGDKEDGSKVELFKKGESPLAIAAGIGATLFGLAKTNAPKVVTDIVLENPGTGSIWKELSSGTAQLLGFKGNGAKVPLSGLNQVGKVSGQSQLSSVASTKASAGAASATMLLANLIQIGATLALNIATVNILDGRIDAEARGAQVQIDAVNSSMIRLLDKQQGNIDALVAQLDEANTISQQNRQEIDTANFDIQNANNANSQLIGQVNTLKQSIRDLKTQNENLITEINAENLEVSEVLDNLTSQAQDTINQLNEAEVIIQAQESTITELTNRIEKLETKVTDLQAAIDKADAQYVVLKYEVLQLKQDLSGEINLVDDRVSLLEGKVLKTQKFVKANPGGGSTAAVTSGTATAQNGVLELTNNLAGNPIELDPITDTDVSTNTSKFNDTLQQLLPQINTGTVTPQQIDEISSNVRTGVSSDLTTILGSSIVPRLNDITEQTTDRRMADATKKGLCESLNGGSCPATPSNPNPTQGLGGLQNNLKGSVDQLNAGLNATIISQNQAIKSIVQNTNEVINHGTYGLKKIQEYADIAWKATHADKALQVINTAFLIHNGMMLSNNLAQTIGEAASMGLQALGIKDSNDSFIDVNALVRDKFTTILTNIVGKEQYTALTVCLAKANCIYQSGVNVLDTTRNLFDSAHSIAEISTEHTGKIGNALREAGVVAEDAYDHMIEKVNPQNVTMSKLAKFREGIDNIEDVVSTVSQVSSEVVEVRENFTQLKSEKKDFLDEIILEKEEKLTEELETKDLSQVRTEIDQGDFDRATPTEEVNNPV